ncbi:MAG: Ppx/GppA phosphatase family protein, partial [Gaiellaceae bacterium]
MRVGVVDIGSNTIRLLVAEVEAGAVVPIDKGRVRLSLGEEIELRGGVSETSIATAAKSVRKLCTIARRHHVDSLDVFLTAPGRQSDNADELIGALRRAADHPVRVLSTEEEGRLAYGGAVATAD